MASPRTPWERTSHTNSRRNSGAASPSPSSFQLRSFSHNGFYTNRSPSSPSSPTQVERPPIPIPFWSRSTALRLAKRAELLDKRLNVHVRPTATPPRPEPHALAELEGNMPVIAELEGSGPTIPELEGSTPNAFNAVKARVFPASAVKEVQVKAKRVSRRLFNLRPEKTHYDVACTNAAAEIAQAELDMKERRGFADKLNACRKAQHLPLLEWNDDLASHAQHHADNLPTPLDARIPSPTGPFSATDAPIPFQPDTVSTARSPFDLRRTVARITSDRGLGAMACVERWYGGKHRRHAVAFVDRERHREDSCPCRLAVVFDTVMSPGLGRIGVGRATERDASGVWVVELAA